MQNSANGNANVNQTTWFQRKWKEYAGADIVVLLILAITGVAVPDMIWDDHDSWKQPVPGQRANLTFVHPITQVTYAADTWLEDPRYNRDFNDDETIDSNQLFGICAIMPPIYIWLFLYIMSRIETAKSHKRFEKHWRWYEFITFGYAFIIAMSLNYWINKTLKTLVSMPIPDFYPRCDLDATDLNNLHCVNDDVDEIRKSWKSFPSGHSSNMFTSGTVLVLYTWNKLNIFDTFKFEFLEHRWYYRGFLDFLCLWPILLAAWGASTRVSDHVHTPTDILGGACLGYVVGRIGYYSQYKHGSPWSYRLLVWPEVRKVIEKHSTLKRKIYPKLFQKKMFVLLSEMTKYRFEVRDEKSKRNPNSNTGNKQDKNNNNTGNNNNNNRNGIDTDNDMDEKDTELAIMDPNR